MRDLRSRSGSVMPPLCLSGSLPPLCLSLPVPVMPVRFSVLRQFRYAFRYAHVSHACPPRPPLATRPNRLRHGRTPAASR